MINRLLKILTAGIKQIQLNARLLLVVILLLIIPGLFIWVAQSFFSASYQNINTSERQAVDTLHDSIELAITEGVSEQGLQNYLLGLVASSDKIKVTKARILIETETGLEILYSANEDEVGLIEGARELYDTAAITPDTSLIFDLAFENTRTWQAFRKVNAFSDTYYIFSEHSFRNVDAIMLKQQQKVYLVLPVIFLFLIALAYWLLRQTHWQKKYFASKDKLKEQMLFTNTIAHELRAPLTAIRGYLSFLLESNSLSSEEQQYAKNIDLSSDRMLALITDFLEVARIQSGNLKLKFADHDVRDTIRAVESEFKSIAIEKGLKLSMVMPNHAVLAETDAQRLQQVLTNLVSNALKYTEKGSVTISLEQTRLKTTIVIKDTGLGIAAEDQSKLFGAFTRVGRADESGVTGTGLGMWITKQLIELLHGEVYVESIEGVGTHVKLTFDV